MTVQRHTAHDDWQHCRNALPLVSRTFALSIRWLPADLRHSVTISYLVCRIADTIEDAPGIDNHRRSELFEALADALSRPHVAHSSWGLDATLPVAVDAVLREWHRLSNAERDAARPWILEMIHGMKQMLPEASGALRFAAVRELHQYCYYVAGTVGHLLTGLFALHRGAVAARAKRLSGLATDFGIGLQLTNVIRDLREDVDEGRLFLPRELWPGDGASTASLFAPSGKAAAYATVAPLIEEAQQRLARGLDYSLTLPRTSIRLRVFCMSSLLLARRTLRAIVGRQQDFDRGMRIKVRRREVYGVFVISALFAPFNRLSRLLFTLA